MKSNENNFLEIDVVNDKLTISIGVPLLLHAIIHSPNYGLSNIKITDQSEFLREFISELLNEDESGANIIHEMFDKAANNAIENGCNGVEEVQHG